jgi:hypothetical protein
MTEQTETPVNNVQAISAVVGRINNLTSLIRRSDLFSGIGESYDGDRDLYEALGYKTDPTYEDFRGIWAREGIPKRVNNAPCNAVWGSPPRIEDKAEADESPFESAWNDLVEEFGLWSRFNRADKLLGFGPYSVLVLGFSDVRTIDDMKNEVRGPAPKLKFVQCYGSATALVNTVVSDPTNPRYGLPETYQIRPSTVNTAGVTQVTSQRDLIVYWERVIHLVEENLESEALGEPRLRVAYNRLKDIEKILGGSAEMFWRGARPGFNTMIDKDANWDQDSPEIATLRTQLDEYEHNLRRILLTQGVEMKGLDTQVADPLNHLKAQLQDVAAATNIPIRILVGSEEGQLAGAQDSAHWDDFIAGRREEWAEPIVIRQFIDRLIDVGTLPKPADEDYDVIWPDLRTPSDKEKAEVGRTRAEAANKILSAPGGDMLIPPDQMIRYFLGLDSEEAISAIQEEAEEMAAREAEEIEEDEGAVIEEPVIPPDLDEGIGD